MKTALIKIVLFFTSTILYSQNLTISSSGDVGPTSGTNWSISGNTLNVGASGSANINPSVISNYLNKVGNLTIVLPWQSGQVRDCNISGSITYTGSATRTLTFRIANSIFMNASNNSISATGTGALNVVLRSAIGPASFPDSGRITVRNNNSINTNGGHLWMGSGPTDQTWNGLTVGNSFATTWDVDATALWIENSTLNTNGGNLSMRGLSHVTVNSSGTTNCGVRITGSTISTSSGSININGDIYGAFVNGMATIIEPSSTSASNISSTSGSIYISGYGATNTNNVGWRHGFSIWGTTSLPSVVSSNSGNIQVEGWFIDCTFNDHTGVIIGGNSRIVSRSGNISFKGTVNNANAGIYSNDIRFAPVDTANSIRIGFDGTNAYTGNIQIEANSLYQRLNHPSSGSIAIQTSGALSIISRDNAFTHLRAGDAGTLTFDNDWNFGTNLGSFTFGKSTNTFALTYSNALTTNGAITFNVGSLNQNAAFTTTAASGHIIFNATGDIIQSAAISTQGGSLVAWADRDGIGGGRIHFNANITTNGGHIYAGGGSVSETANGLTVPTGFALSSDAAFSGLIVNGCSIVSGGGTIRMRGEVNAVNGTNAGVMVFGNATVNSGSGAMTMIGKRTGDPNTSAGLFLGTRIDANTATGNVTLTSTSGNIYLEGTTENITASHVWSLGLAIVEYGGDDVTITSTTGNITLIGDAASAATQVGEALGFVIQSDNTTGLTRISTDGGAITISGRSGDSADDIGASYRGANSAGNITIGDANTGNITLRFGSLSGYANTGAVSIQSAGNYVIEGINGGAFATTIDINDSFVFGTTGTSMRIGSTNNNQNVWFRPAISVSGPITAYANEFLISKNWTSTTASNIEIYANTHFWTNDVRQTIQTAGGNILIAADADANGTGQLNLDYLTLNPGSGSTTIRGETVSFAVGVNGPYLNGTGNITIEPSDAAFGITFQTSWFTFDQDNNGMGGFNFGKAGNTAQISIDGQNLTAGGHVNLYGNNIVIGAAITASAHNIGLFANTAVTQTQPIVSSGLLLSGTGTFTLTNTSNNFTTLAGGAAGNLLGATQIIDASGGLTIGTVGSNTGLTGSNTIRVETLAGDLTLAGSISTTSTSTDAVILTSAKNTAIGVPTGVISLFPVTQRLRWVQVQ